MTNHPMTANTPIAPRPEPGDYHSSASPEHEANYQQALAAHHESCVLALMPLVEKHITECAECNYGEGATGFVDGAVCGCCGPARRVLAEVKAARGA